MKKTIYPILLIISTLSTIAQNAVLISPTGTETIKFNNSISEKITFFDNGVNSKHGIGLSQTVGVQSRFNFYVNSVTDDFVFGVGSLASFSEKMRIKGNGNVGIGTTSPAAPLHIESTSDNPLIIGGGSGLYVSYKEGSLWRGYFGSYYGNSQDVDFGTHSLNPTGKVHFTTNGNIRMTIQDNASGGNVEIAGKIVNEAYQIPTFQNSWVNYGFGYETAKFYKDKESRVHLSGGVSRATAANSSIIFTLPVGYRPTNHQTFHVDTVDGTSARITILSNGEVSYYSFTNNANNEYTFISLSGISFRVD